VGNQSKCLALASAFHPKQTLAQAVHIVPKGNDGRSGATTSAVARPQRHVLPADGKSWRFHSSQGEHGHSLVVSGHDANEAIANATTSIAFQVGNWRREIRPAAPLSRFASDCS
jgi:hypothetical protein